MPSMNKLVLFDVDKTLVKSTKGHPNAFRSAIKEVYGVDANIDSINYEGMTDQQIILEVLLKKGLSEDDIKLKLQECMNLMSEHFSQAIGKEEIRPMAGVRELLDELNKHHLIMGLVTGNVEKIARIKLSRAGLEKYFKVGGFGSDHINRAELVKLAIKEAKEKFKLPDGKIVFVIGDTPKDIKAAVEGGAIAVGVATGIHTKEELNEAGAHAVLKNLQDKNKVLEVLEIETPDIGQGV